MAVVLGCAATPMSASVPINVGRRYSDPGASGTDVQPGADHVDDHPAQQLRRWHRQHQGLGRALQALDVAIHRKIRTTPSAPRWAFRPSKHALP